MNDLMKIFIDTYSRVVQEINGIEDGDDNLIELGSFGMVSFIVELEVELVLLD